MHEDSIIRKGKKYFSVTVIINPIIEARLAEWRGRIGNEAADEKKRIGGERGTYRHDLLFAINKGLAPGGIFSDVERDIINGYTKWFDNYVEEIKTIETDMYSDNYLFKGKADMIFRFKGGKRFNVADYKTGSTLNEKDIRLQLAGYAILAKENGIDIDGRYYFNLHDGFKEPERIKKKNHSEDDRIFLYQNEVYRYYNL